MPELTKNEMALLYLGGFSNSDPVLSASVPVGMTQDGIAGALGISRGYAALITSRMMALGLVEGIQKHITGSKGRRLAYFLTPKGMEEASRIRKGAESNGDDVTGMFLRGGVDGCSAEELSALDPDDRDVLGWLCLMESDVMRTEIPSRAAPILRFGRRGEVRLMPETREAMLATASEEDLVRWHCIAAEWFADRRPQDPERLIHLALGRRSIEASGLVMEQRCRILDSPDIVHLRALKEVCRVSKDPRVHETAVMLALSLRDMASAREVLSGAACLKGDGLKAMRAELAIMEGG